jgi:serine/threonine protein kinase
MTVMKTSEPPKELCSRCGTRLAPDLHGLCETCLLRFSLGIGEPLPLDDDAAGRSFFDLLEPSLPERARVFGDYELVEEIGAGGMGVVWRARQKSLNRLVALKMIRAGQLARPEDVQRFRTEAEAAARLQHPGVVAIYEIGEVEGQHFFSMELIEGPTLAKSLSDGPFAPRRAAAVVRQVAFIVAYAHSRGILHRDLKPSNILLSVPDPNPNLWSDPADEPHVTDFGLAKVLTSTAELTRTQSILGSPAYMSPEQATGATIDSRADLYSLGAILYESLTGRPPFQAESPIATLRQVVDNEPVSPRLLNPEVPLDLATICLKCLEKDPAKRYPTTQALADDLQRYLNNEPITARPITRTAKLLRWSQRNPALATAYSLLILLFILILIGSPLAIYRINQAREAEVGARRRAEAQTYSSDMNLVLQAWEEGNAKRAQALLRAHIPKLDQVDDLRGFEWRYLTNLCHDESSSSFDGFSTRVNLAPSSDGRLLVAASGSILKLLDPETRVDLGSLRAQGSTIASLFLSPAGRNLVALGTEGTQIELWDIGNRAPGRIARYWPQRNLACCDRPIRDTTRRDI